MKTKNIIFFMTLILSLYGCRNEHCEGFPDELANYFPYSKEQTVVFVNENKDTLECEIEDIQKTMPYYENSCKCACAPPNIRFDLTSSYFLEKLTGSLLLNEDGTLSFEFQFYTSGEWQHLDYFQISIPQTTEEILSIENQDAIRISDVQLIKGKGIISFYDRQLKCTWSLAEN